ncbi:hypothetical protein Tco_1317199 [Tanacetum coccineum]
MGDENPIRTLGDYSKPSHEGYRNTIELPVGKNVVPLRSDTITVECKTECLPRNFGPRIQTNKLKDFLKLVDSLDLDGENRERTRHHPLMTNESWNDPRDFAKPIKVIALPQDVPSTSDRRLIELGNQVQRLMEAHLALTQPTQVNKITTSCEICSGPHDTQYCMEDPELTKFEADFKQQQSEMTNKIDTVLKAIVDRIAGALPSDMPNVPMRSISAVTIHPKQKSKSLDDKPEENREEEKNNLENIHANPFTPPDPSIPFITKIVLKLNSFFESLGLVPQSSNTKLVCTKGDDDDVMYIEIVKTDDDSHKEEPKAGEQEVEYFDIILTRIKLAYYKYLMCGPIPSIFLWNPIIMEGCLSNLKIP